MQREQRGGARLRGVLGPGQDAGGAALRHLLHHRLPRLLLLLRHLQHLLLPPLLRPPADVVVACGAGVTAAHRCAAPHVRSTSGQHRHMCTQPHNARSHNRGHAKGGGQAKRCRLARTPPSRSFQPKPPACWKPELSVGGTSSMLFASPVGRLGGCDGPHSQERPPPLPRQTPSL